MARGEDRVPEEGGTIVIAANGETPEGAARAALERAGRLVACDGAYARLKALGFEPDLVVGDGDSLAPADRAALGARFAAVAEQDTNDLEKAFNAAWARYGVGRVPPPRVVIVGAGGGREDHLIGNVFRLLRFAEVAPDVAMVTNAGRFDVVTGARTFASREGQAVSVFAPAPGTRMTSEGLCWPLEGVDLGDLWRGTLNRAAGARFTLAATAPVLVYRAD